MGNDCSRLESSKALGNKQQMESSIFANAPSALPGGQLRAYIAPTKRHFDRVFLVLLLKCIDAGYTY